MIENQLSDGHPRVHEDQGEQTIFFFLYLFGGLYCIKEIERSYN